MENFKQNPHAFLISFRVQDLIMYYGKQDVFACLSRKMIHPEIALHITNLVNTYGVSQVNEMCRLIFSKEIKAG